MPQGRKAPGLAPPPRHAHHLCHCDAGESRSPELIGHPDLPAAFLSPIQKPHDINAASVVLDACLLISLVCETGVQGDLGCA